MLLKTVAVEIFKGRNNKGGQGSTQYPYTNYQIVSFFNLEIVENSNISIFYLINWIFDAETIHEIFKGGNCMRKYGMHN